MSIIDEGLFKHRYLLFSLRHFIVLTLITCPLGFKGRVLCVFVCVRVRARALTGYMGVFGDGVRTDGTIDGGSVLDGSF